MPEAMTISKQALFKRTIKAVTMLPTKKLRKFEILLTL